MINDWMIWLSLFFFGSFVSVIYFGLLWLFVKKFSQRALGILEGIFGLLLRLGLMGITLYFILKKFELVGLAIFLIGFVTVKQIIQFKIKKQKTYENHNR